MKSIYFLLLLLCALLSLPTYAQIGMGGQPHPSAVLDLKATDKALYPPRLTTVQRKAIVNPQPGAFVYDLDQSTFYLFDGANWLPLAFQNPANIMPTTRLASDGAAGDYFGGSVAISGDYAIIGAIGDAIGANSSQGSAYVFVRSGNSWTFQTKLTASDGAAGDNFGISVAISGDYAIVGAYVDDIGANTNQGSAYLFVRSGSSWTQQAKLTASDGAAGDNFGISVAISGDYAIVGAYNDDIGANGDQGSAYVFERSVSGWTQQAKLTASDGAGSDNFGFSVAIAGDYAIVGAYRDDNTYGDQGSAYLFVRGGGTWTFQTKLTASDGALSDSFGISVAISGDYAIVGTEGDDIGANGDQGSAYVFVRLGSSWIFQTKLTASDGAVNDRFGSGVAISGDYAIVGAFGDAIGANSGQGSAYVFRRTGSSWTLVRQVTDNSPANTGNGYSVGISNGSFIIGGYGFESNKGKVSFGTVDN